MKYLCGLMALMFSFFAFLQLNDPDPVLWTSLYLVPVVLSLVKAHWKLILSVGLTYEALAIWWWNFGVAGLSCGEMFGKITWPDFLAAEPVRESLGLAIAGTWLVSLGLLKRGAEGSRPREKKTPAA